LNKTIGPDALYTKTYFYVSGGLPGPRNFKCQNAHFNRTIANGQRRMGSWSA
jgi:hypothetical protein